MTRRKTSAAERFRDRISEAQELADAEVMADGEVTPQRSGAAYSEVPIAAVAENLSNVRDQLGDLSELTESVRAVGVLQPLVVRPVTAGERADYPEGTRYVAVMGNRRRAAAIAAGRDMVPVVVRDDITTDNQRLRMLVENLQREDLTPLEEARAFQSELDKGMSQHQLAQAIGVTQPHISRRLTLLRLEPTAQALVADNRLGVDVAVNSLSRLDAADQKAIAEDIAEQTRGLVDPGMVRRAVQELQREREREQRREKAMAKASEAGAARTLSWSEARAELGDAVYHPLTSNKEIAEAAAAGELVAVLDDNGTTMDEPRFLSNSSSKAAAAERREDPQAQERRVWRERQRAIESWVAEHRQAPPRAELTAALQRFVVETMSAEHGKVVHKWLKGVVGDAEGDFDVWRRSLTEADYAVVAWLMTVASDLSRTKYCGLDSTEAGQRTRSRLGEVADRG